ncbi:transposase [Niabella aurantiaca]|uniref:transposase n=1 Tax=Niabella aurantiaca TaxID=379900 RepID=UPI000A01D681
MKNKDNKYKSFNLYFQDESRFGLFTRVGRILTARGIQPICPYQHKFDNTYLFGAFSPITGDSMLLELPYCNTDMFQYFLEQLSVQKPQELQFVILDNGAFHKAKRLQVPDNIILIFLPPTVRNLIPQSLFGNLSNPLLPIKHLKHSKNFLMNLPTSSTYNSLPKE